MLLFWNYYSSNNPGKSWSVSIKLWSSTTAVNTDRIFLEYFFSFAIMWINYILMENRKQLCERFKHLNVVFIKRCAEIKKAVMLIKSHEFKFTNWTLLYCQRKCPDEDLWTKLRLICTFKLKTRMKLFAVLKASYIIRIFYTEGRAGIRPSSRCTCTHSFPVERLSSGRNRCSKLHNGQMRCLKPFSRADLFLP